jgi:hypothetical protein
MGLILYSIAYRGKATAYSVFKYVAVSLDRLLSYIRFQHMIRVTSIYSKLKKSVKRSVSTQTEMCRLNKRQGTSLPT